MQEEVQENMKENSGDASTDLVNISNEATPIVDTKDDVAENADSKEQVAEKEAETGDTESNQPSGAGNTERDETTTEVTENPETM